MPASGGMYPGVPIAAPHPIAASTCTPALSWSTPASPRS